MQPVLISSKQFHQLLGISSAAFFRLRHSGKIGVQSIKLGRSIRWDAAEVDAWIKAKCPNMKQWQSR